jgi:hypothetical protein
VGQNPRQEAFVSRYPQLPVRHAVRSDDGVSFIDYLNRLADERGVLRQRQLAFINEWDCLVDDLGRRPTPADYAERWKMPRSTVYSLLAEFRQLFPGQTDPTDLCREIWEGVAAQQHEAPFGIVDWEQVRVVPLAA